MIKKTKVLVLLWHPEAPYAGGSFEVIKNSFLAREKSEIEWHILDKEGSNLINTSTSFYFFYEYKIPEIIKKITKFNFVAGRLIEWLYIFFLIYRRASFLINF